MASISSRFASSSSAPCTRTKTAPSSRRPRRNDPRLTRIGRWLRRWNIDELPQLFNVLTGDMSLVGPRPHALSHDHEYERRISLYARRHNVKPGITGWAQINGFRGEIDSDDKIRKRVEYDLFYIDNWSLWLDLKIMARTVLSPSAYEQRLLSATFYNSKNGRAYRRLAG